MDNSTPEIPKPEEASQQVTEEQAKAALQRLNPEKANEDESIQRVRTRIQELKTMGEEMAKALGLPPEAKYEVLSVMSDTARGTESNIQGPTPGPTPGK